MFDRGWDELDLASLRRFFADAGDEGLTWETKGSEFPRPDSIRKAVAGFANQAGGFLIIGASRDKPTGQWRVDGVPFDRSGGGVKSEPGTWIGSLIAPTGVTPTPTFDAKEFWLDDDGLVLVVRVEPIAIPPCLTSSGIVYQRVVGATPPVTDQVVLADLLRRGQTARIRVEDSALRAARRLLDDLSAYSAQHTPFSVAMCAAGATQSGQGSLFLEARATAFASVVADQLQPDHMLRYGTHVAIQQDGIRIRTASSEIGAAVTAFAFWDGAVAASLSVEDDDFTVPELTNNVTRYWRALTDVLSIFNWSGDAHLVVAFNEEKVRAANPKGPVPVTDVRRWTASGAPSDDEVASVVREIERGFGRPSWEPAHVHTP